MHFCSTGAVLVIIIIMLDVGYLYKVAIQAIIYLLFECFYFFLIYIIYQYNSIKLQQIVN